MSDSEGERRPRPIGARDENEEDSDDDRRGPQPESNAAADGAAADTAAAQVAPEEASKKPASTRRPAFSENDLVKEKGLLQIYKQFPQKCQYKGKGREREFLRGLMVAYKEWGYQLYPGIAFEDLASRTEKLGGRERTRDFMHELRDTERDRYVEAKYGASAVDTIHAQDAAKLAAKEAAAAEKRAKEEKENTRYMEVDEEGADGVEGAGGESQTTGGDGGGGGGVSEEVRERMEVNRRRALERLRLKKEEATAAAGVGGVVSPAATAGGAKENDDPQEMDVMDEESGWARGGGDDDFEDDEAALAEMEEEEVAKRATSVNAAPSSAAVTPALAGVAAAPTPADADAAVEGEIAAQQSQDSASPVVDTLVESTELEEDAEMGEAEAETGASQITARGVAPTVPLTANAKVGLAPLPLGADASAGEVPPSVVAAAALDANQTSGGNAMIDAAGLTNDDIVASEKSSPNSGAPPHAGLTEREEAVADKPEDSTSPSSRAGKDNQEGSTSPASEASKRGSSTPSSSEPGTASEPSTEKDNAAALGAQKPTARATTTGGRIVGSGVEETVFSSPGKLRAAGGGGMPLSPLGSMFAGTDVPAEGGTAVVAKESLAGLFSNE
eukprot:jgi/Undpi1/9078/HiC_scaffold_26.g11538.m1